MEELINAVLLIATKLDAISSQLDDTNYKLESIETEIRDLGSAYNLKDIHDGMSSIENEISNLGNGYNLKDIHSQLELMDMNLSSIEMNTNN